MQIEIKIIKIITHIWKKSYFAEPTVFLYPFLGCYNF